MSYDLRSFRNVFDEFGNVAHLCKKEKKCFMITQSLESKKKKKSLPCHDVMPEPIVVCMAVQLQLDMKIMFLPHTELLMDAWGIDVKNTTSPVLDRLVPMKACRQVPVAH